MKTLYGSSLKGVCFNLEKENWGHFWSQRPEICSLGLPSGNHNANLTLLSSVERKTLRPVFSASSSALSSSSSNSQSQFEGEEMESKDEFKTARVKFQLERQCTFGQQFLIVGDDPVLGSWDPSNAVPLTWSDGHVWTVEMDIPCGICINYKFILKGAANTILWQPGPDRILKAWETSNIITVREDWDNIELQEITEEELLTREPDESLINSEVMIAENLTQEGIDLNANADEPLEIVAENITGTEEDVDASNASGSKDENYVEETAKTGPSDFGNDRIAAHGENLISEDEAGLTSDEGVPVLVPGLDQIVSVETEAMPSDESQKGTVSDGSLGSSKAEEFTLEEDFELKNSKEESSSHGKETSDENEMFTNIRGIEEDNGHVQEPEFEEYEHNKKEQLESGAIESDLQWGRKTIKKFLNNLGWL